MKKAKSIIDKTNYKGDFLAISKEEAMQAALLAYEAGKNEICYPNEKCTFSAPRFFCDECMHFIVLDVDGEIDEDITKDDVTELLKESPCDLKHPCKFKYPSDVNASDFGFYRRGCKDYRRNS